MSWLFTLGSFLWLFQVENRAELIEEMCRLYGEEKSGEILSFETSMQARFNLKCDSGAGAKHWPCIPLKMNHWNIGHAWIKLDELRPTCVQDIFSKSSSNELKCRGIRSVHSCSSTVGIWNSDVSGFWMLNGLVFKCYSTVFITRTKMSGFWMVDCSKTRQLKCFQHSNAHF